jgi:orotidine-5'-phosphate decarboxylase
VKQESSGAGTFADRLDAAIARRRTPVVVGIDPHVELLPDEFAVARDKSAARTVRAKALGDFACELVEAIADLVPAVKPQSAFFEELGADGIAQWERVIGVARAAGLLAIGDVKRGDIASTARAYASAFLEASDGASCDAITVSPYLGGDSIAPFLEVCRRTGGGLFVLVRTSNPGSADFQRHGEPELSFRVADAVAKWGASMMGECGLSSVGAVVGATHSSELARFRERMPNTPLLLPGYGAQGATARDLRGAFLPGDGATPRGALVNASRSIAFAFREPRFAKLHWKDAARAAALAMIEELRAVDLAR